MPGIVQRVLAKRAAQARQAALDAELQRALAAAKGEPGMRWRGQWRKDEQYAVDDVVGHKGSAYIALEDSQGAAPPHTAWDLVVQRGRDGKAGKDGKAGGVVVVGGGGEGGGGLDPTALELITDPNVSDNLILERDGQVWRVSIAALVSLFGTPLPAGTVTVDGEPVTVGAEYVTVT